MSTLGFMAAAAILTAILFLVAVSLVADEDHRLLLIGIVVVVVITVFVVLLDKAETERDHYSAELAAVRVKLAQIKRRAVAAGMGCYVERVVKTEKEFVFYNEIASGSAEVVAPR